MKLAIANDHRGYDLKKYIIKHLKGVEIVDLGSDNTKSDYSKQGIKLGEYVVKNKCYGLAICGSGIGISIACNKVKGVRCAKVNFIKEAKVTREDNNSNIVAISGEMNEERALRIVETFINQKFNNEERHVKRINQINEYESNR
ncbi:MAG: RpiB/LacA/LacB family sugar-phosphate isomerase [Bacilli bacterium]|nr:RpiB/LacA/LacB family sugar-phosphate isomerase [Bacilli bacterium]